MFVVFVALATLLNVPWRNHTFGIIQGFAISALGTWIAYRIRSRFGIKFLPLAIYSPPVAYILAACLWLFTFSRHELGEEHGPSLPVQPSELLDDLKRSTELLWRFIKKP